MGDWLWPVAFGVAGRRIRVAAGHPNDSHWVSWVLASWGGRSPITGRSPWLVPSGRLSVAVGRRVLVRDGGGGVEAAGGL